MFSNWKLVVSLTLLFLLNTFSYGQDVEHNRIMIMDVTKSMVGYGQSENIFEEVKKSMINQVLYAPYDGGDIIIIPFSDRVLNDEQKVFGNDIKGREKAINFIRSFQVPDEITNTNICEAWDYSLNTYLKSPRRNIFYVFTDGKQNMDYTVGGRTYSKDDCLARIIQKYCKESKLGKEFTYFISYRPDLLKAKDVDGLSLSCENLVFDKPTDGKVFPKMIYMSLASKSAYFGLQNMQRANVQFNIVDKPDDLRFDARLVLDEELPSGVLLALKKAKAYEIDGQNEVTFELQGIPSLDAVSKALESGQITGKIIFSNPRAKNAKVKFTKTKEVRAVISNKKFKTLTFKVLEEE